MIPLFCRPLSNPIKNNDTREELSSTSDKK